MMKIVTWNCAGAFRNKAEQLRALKPDLAIVQECEHPDKMAKTEALSGFQTCAWFGDPQNKGKGLIVLSPHLLAWEIDRVYDPSIQWCIPLRLSGAMKINLLAVWTKAHRIRKDGYIGQLYRAVIAYESFLQEYPTVVVGDFNSNQIWDSARPGKNHSAVVQLLQNAGMVSAYHIWHEVSHGQEHTSTFHMNRQCLRGFHIDYCFLPIQWMEHVKQVSIGSYLRWKHFSDHRPLSVTIDSKVLALTTY